MPFQQGFFCSDSQHHRPIHSERFGGGATRRRLAYDMRINPIEMLVPLVLPGMIQRGGLVALGINGVPARGFVQGTRYTSKRQIIRSGGSASGKGYDVVDVKGSRLSLLRKPAILTAMVRPCDDQLPQSSWDIAHGVDAEAAARSARRRSSDKNSARATRPSASWRSATVRVSPWSWRSSSVWSRFCTAGGSSHWIRCKSIVT